MLIDAMQVDTMLVDAMLVADTMLVDAMLVDAMLVDAMLVGGGRRGHGTGGEDGRAQHKTRTHLSEPVVGKTMKINRQLMKFNEKQLKYIKICKRSIKLNRARKQCEQAANK